MSDSTRPDVNFLSTYEDGLWHQNTGGTTSKVVDFPEDGKVNPPNAAKLYASLLKITSNAVVDKKGLDIGQAAENSVDIQHGAKATLEGRFGCDEDKVGDQIFSIKGGSWAKITGYLRGSGSRLNADIIVDTWSDQSLAGSYADLTNLIHIKNRRIRVVKRYFASTVVAHSSNVEILVLASIENTIYWWAKRIVRAVLRIPIGTKGPSWM
jgi:hypothetical protein